jgi:hypothetical protein
VNFYTLQTAKAAPIIGIFLYEPAFNRQAQLEPLAKPGRLYRCQGF